MEADKGIIHSRFQLATVIFAAAERNRWESQLAGKIKVRCTMIARWSYSDRTVIVR